MKERKQMGRVKQTLICLAATLVVGLIYFYFELPALNFHSPAFILSSSSCAQYTVSLPSLPLALALQLRNGSRYRLPDSVNFLL